MHKINSKSAHNKSRCSQQYSLVLHHVTSLTPRIRTPTCAVCAAHTAIQVVPTKPHAIPQLRFQAGVFYGLGFFSCSNENINLKNYYFPTIDPQHVTFGLYSVRMFEF